MELRTIAVVDHSPSFFRLMQAVLDSYGFRMLACADSNTASDEIAKAHPDLVLIDTWLKFEDEGWQVLQNLRLDPTTSEIPIIVSSTDTRNIAERTAELEAMKNVYLLPKPFSPEALMVALDQMLPGPLRERA